MAAVTLVLAIASASAIAGTVSCDSYNGGRNTCSADTRNGVALARQVSWNKCKKGVSGAWSTTTGFGSIKDAAGYSRPEWDGRTAAAVVAVVRS